MPESVVVLVADPDDPKHGEISVLEDADKAARLVETLLEAGFAQDRIRVFSGVEIEKTVTYRPVVSLVGGGDGSPSDDGDEGDGDEGESAEEPIPSQFRRGA